MDKFQHSIFNSNRSAWLINSPLGGIYRSGVKVIVQLPTPLPYAVGMKVKAKMIALKKQIAFFMVRPPFTWKVLYQTHPLFAPGWCVLPLANPTYHLLSNKSLNGSWVCFQDNLKLKSFQWSDNYSLKARFKNLFVGPTSLKKNLASIWRPDLSASLPSFPPPTRWLNILPLLLRFQLYIKSKICQYIFTVWKYGFKLQAQ